MRVVLAALVASGCYQPTPHPGAPCGENDVCPSGLTCSNGICVVTPGDGGGGSDSRPPDAVMCDGFTAHHFDPCALPAGGAVALTAQYEPFTLDTDGTVTSIKGKMNNMVPITTTVIDQGTTPALLISSDDFRIDAGVTLRVTGSRPLIIASRSTIAIAGTISINGIRASTAAGSNPASLCTVTAPTAGISGAGGAGGGGGGGFQSPGGAGGAGDSDTGPRAGGASGAAVTVPTIVRGGCGGALGGSGGGGSASPGAGGGAIQLTAKSAITIAGSINAGGGGGNPGISVDGGGAGGGAGGYIGLEAPTVTITGGIAANGGGGGEGNNASVVIAGADGAVSTSAALGGSSGVCGTAGGNGGAFGLPRGADVTIIDACGGGGGGGGVGFILVWGQLVASGTVSPMPILNPF